MSRKVFMSVDAIWSGKQIQKKYGSLRKKINVKSQNRPPGSIASHWPDSSP